MSKKVLILSSSPRKGGNSDLLCEAFLKGAQEAGNSAEKVFLRDHKVGYCVDCGYCRKSAGACSQKDDMAALLDKMAEADVIVLASPVYFYTLDAQAKTLIDRTVARYTALTDKEFYFIMTMADQDLSAMDRTLECFRGWTDCLGGAVEKGVIRAGGVWMAGEVEGHPAMKEAYEMGRSV